jgi:hypothetical protein
MVCEVSKTPYWIHHHTLKDIELISAAEQREQTEENEREIAEKRIDLEIPYASDFIVYVGVIVVSVVFREHRYIMAASGQLRRHPLRLGLCSADDIGWELFDDDSEIHQVRIRDEYLYGLILYMISENLH